MRLHGREAEEQVIDGLLAGAREGRSGAIVVRGGTGIGKTALLSYAAASADGMTLLRTAGAQTEAELPFAGLHLLLRPVLDRIDALPLPQATALRGALGPAERGSHDRFLVGLAVLSMVAALAEVSPVLCLIDDAHWLDAASTDALLFTARRLEADGVVMILAARDGTRPFSAPGLADLPLAALDSAQAGQMLDERAERLPFVMRERIIAEAGGNPLALAELARALTADSRTAGAGPLPVTHSVQELLADQIRRLGEPTSLLLLLAAAEWSGDLAPVLSAAAALEIDEEGLTAAERAGLVTVEEARLVFRHPLVRAAAYHGAPLAQRQAAHRALAAALDGQPDPDGRRAWHLAAGTSRADERVAAALAQAAERSRGRGGSAAVSAAYERAAQLTPDNQVRARRLLAAATAANAADQPDRAENLADQVRQLTGDALTVAEICLVRMTGSTGDQRRRILELASAVTQIAGRYPERAAAMMGEALRAAIARADRDLTRQLLAQVDLLRLPQGAGLRGMDAATVQHARFLTGDLRNDVGAVRDFVTAIRQDPGGAAPGDRVSASALAFWLGDLDATADISAALAAECRRAGMVGWLPGALQGVSIAQALCGEWTAARANATEGLKLAQDMGQRPRAAFLMVVLDLLAAYTGDADGCQALLAESTRLEGSIVHRDHRNYHLALTNLASGRFALALDQLADVHLRWWSGNNQFMFLPDLVEAGARAGDLEQARQALAGFEDWLKFTSAPWAQAVAHRCRALLSDDAHAEPHYQAAVTVAGPGARRPFEQARSHLVYGEWLRRRRRRGAARHQLTTAHQIFAELGARTWAERAATELAATGAAPAAGQAWLPAAVAQLTPQELQVTRLAADGLSNREIGAQLFLSPRTVGYHLYKAYPKLGIGSRTELARLLAAEEANRRSAEPGRGQRY